MGSAHYAQQTPKAIVRPGGDIGFKITQLYLIIWTVSAHLAQHASEAPKPRPSTPIKIGLVLEPHQIKPNLRISTSIFVSDSLALQIFGLDGKSA